MSMKRPSSPEFHSSVEQKLKTENSVKLYRFATPRLRAILRKNCRMRIDEARQQSSSKNRPVGAVGEKNFLREILREELAEMVHDLFMQVRIFNELEDELNEWIADQVQQDENYLIEMDSSQDLVCPICQVANLLVCQTEDGRFNYRCECNANFNFASDMECMRSKLFQSIDEHEQNCLIKLSFFVNPLTKQLEGICDDCYYFCSL